MAYVIALGSNRCSGRYGRPSQVVRAAMTALETEGIVVDAVSSIVSSKAMGSSRRCYANAAVLVASADGPPAILARLKAIERAFGRRRGQRWGSRVLDLDIILWSGGRWPRGLRLSRQLNIPHRDYLNRDFVLRPMLDLPTWRDPWTALTVRQASARLASVRRPRRLGRQSPPSRHGNT